jgi:hypothetical protein
MSNTMETQTNDIDAFWQLQEAQEKVVTAVQQMMYVAKLRFEAGKDWSAFDTVPMSEDMCKKVEGWARLSMVALAKALMERTGAWCIDGNAVTRGKHGLSAFPHLVLTLNASRWSDAGLFEEIDALIEECFED